MEKDNKNEKFILRENLKRVNNEIDARRIGCHVFDYELYRKNELSETVFLFLFYGLMFGLGVLVGKGIL